MSTFIPFECTDTSCPLFSHNDCVPTEIIERIPGAPISVLFVGEAPGKDEAMDKRPFIGVPGKLLRRIIQYVAPKKNIALSNVCRCNPKTDSKHKPPTELEVKTCSHWLKEDIHKINPAVIVPLGNIAMGALLGLSGINENRGVPVKMTRIYLPTFHPATVLKYEENPIELNRFVNDIMMAFVLAEYGLDDWYTAPGECRLLTTVNDVESFITTLLNTSDVNVAIDFETDNLNRVYGNAILSAQFSTDGKIGTVIPVHHKQTPFSESEIEEVKKQLKRVFTEKPKFKAWLAHNCMFEEHIVYSQLLGKVFRNKPVLDTMGGAYLLNENRTIKGEEKDISKDKKGMLKLKKLVKEFFGFKHFDTDVLVARAEGTLKDLDLDKFSNYGAMDAYCTWRLFEREKLFAKCFDYYDDWYKLLRYLFYPVYLQCVRFEQNGFLIDKKHLALLLSEESPLLMQIEAAKGNFKALASVQETNKVLAKIAMGGTMSLPGMGEPWVFDPNKPGHLQALFFDQLMLTPQTISDKTEKPSVDKKLLRKFANLEEIKILTKYRTLSKLMSSFVEVIDDALKSNPDSADGYLRTNIRFDNTVSGRASSDHPAMQNLPKAKDEDKSQIKNLFLADNPRARQ